MRTPHSHDRCGCRLFVGSGGARAHGANTRMSATSECAPPLLKFGSPPIGVCCRWKQRSAPADHATLAKPNPFRTYRPDFCGPQVSWCRVRRCGKTRDASGCSNRSPLSNENAARRRRSHGRLAYNSRFRMWRSKIQRSATHRPAQCSWCFRPRYSSQRTSLWWPKSRRPQARGELHRAISGTSAGTLRSHGAHAWVVRTKRSAHKKSGLRVPESAASPS